MGSNISRDHIALEAMKIILDKAAIRPLPLIDRIRIMFGRKTKRCRLDYPASEKVAEYAYEFADAMIAEREKVKNKA
jgi:hypothetical protein